EAEGDGGVAGSGADEHLERQMRFVGSWALREEGAMLLLRESCPAKRASDADAESRPIFALQADPCVLDSHPGRDDCNLRTAIHPAERAPVDPRARIEVENFRGNLGGEWRRVEAGDTPNG